MGGRDEGGFALIVWVCIGIASLVSKFESISSAVETSCVNSLRVKILGLVIAEAATSFEIRDDEKKERKRFWFRLRHISQALHVNFEY